MDPQAQGQVEAAFDAWLASIGMTRNSPVPYGQEAYLASQWESFLLNWGKNQGRTLTPGGVYQGPPGGSFEVPRLPVATRAPSMQNNAPRPPAPSSPQQSGAQPRLRYTPPNSQQASYKDPRSRDGVLYGEDRHW